MSFFSDRDLNWEFAYPVYTSGGLNAPFEAFSVATGTWLRPLSVLASGYRFYRFRYALGGRPYITVRIASGDTRYRWWHCRAPAGYGTYMNQFTDTPEYPLPYGP